MDDLFEILSVSPYGDGCILRIRLNGAHEVFRGHFPGRPVLPGVCALDMVKEGVSAFLGRRLRYYRIKECKFLYPVNPDVTVKLTAGLSVNETPEGVEVRGIMEADGQTSLKLRALMIDA